MESPADRSTTYPTAYCFAKLRPGLQSPALAREILHELDTDSPRLTARAARYLVRESRRSARAPHIGS
jgi:hypothetical protein